MISPQQIYNKAPILVQQMLTTASGIQRARRRYGRAYRLHREWLRDYDTWTLDRKLSYQSELLSDFIEFAKHNSPFYRDIFLDSQIGDVRNPGDLNQIPYVDKETLRANIDRVYTVKKTNSAQTQTGGTTGKPLVVRYTFEDQMRRMALLDHFKSRHGFENRQMLKATFSGKRIVPSQQSQKIFWRYNPAVKQILYSTFHLSDENLKHYVQHINRVKPVALDGYISSLSELASYIERKSIPLEFQPVAIFPTAETVTPAHRTLLERVFNCKVLDQYASSEGAPLVTECSYGSMHVELSSGVIENLPNSDEILVTSFQTHGTPLIRYRVGDSMKLNLLGGCGCGIGGPLVGEIYGRSVDYLRRADGAKISSVHITSILRRLPDGIRQVQFRQKVLGELEVVLSLTNDSYRESVEAALERQISYTFGSDTRLKIQFVSGISRAPSGKHRMIENSVG